MGEMALPRLFRFRTIFKIVNPRPVGRALGDELLNFTAFLSYVLLSSVTPGPNNIMSMSNAGRYGIVKSLPFNYGVVAGFFGVIVGAAVFSSVLYSVIPQIMPVMLCLGAAYMLWLAWTVLCSRPGAAGTEERRRTNTFTMGFCLQFVNVKVILYCLTLMSSFILPHYQSLPVLALFCALLSGMCFVSNMLWALFGAGFERFFSRYGRVMNAVMALLLVWCAWSMIRGINL